MCVEDLPGLLRRVRVDLRSLARLQDFQVLEQRILLRFGQSPELVPRVRAPHLTSVVERGARPGLLSLRIPMHAVVARLPAAEPRILDR